MAGVADQRPVRSDERLVHKIRGAREVATLAARGDAALRRGGEGEPTRSNG